ncbi:MAG TPA: NosD domain-containing protein, partial [Candidatus Brocadiia bacterium]|nr:NosD domain-containing protein [Candidatus Brocadiia bacterium]
MIRAALVGMTLFSLAASAGGGEKFDTSPQAVEPLAALAEFRESDFGAGPLQTPGRAFYVSPKGSDAATGESWAAAWQTLRRGLKDLRAGDTLLVDEGFYYEPQTLSLGKVSGQPGQPIRIFAAPRCRAIVTGARHVAGWAPHPAAPRAWAAPLDTDKVEMAWETDTRIQLQYAGSLERVNELPGAFWFDKDNKTLCVRFSDSRLPPGRAVAVRGPLQGLAVDSAYVHVRGLWFEGYSSGVFVGGKGDNAHHVTIEQCAFYGNDMAGLNIMGARHCLIKNNTGRKSGERGVIFTQRMNFNTAGLDNNLIIGNVLHAEPPSVRSGAILHYFAIHHWAGVPSKTYVINNVLDGALSLWWKPLGPGIVVQGNVMTGSFDTTGSLGLKPEDRIIVRNNTMLGSLGWPGESWGPGPGADWVAPSKAFINNLCPRGAEAVAAARFADPAWLDFRLQADSPFRGKGVKGVDRGAFAKPHGRVFYVSPAGDDAADGATDKTPFKTLRKAAAALQPGDTLYIAEGHYAEPLVITASGNEDQPIRVRSLAKKRVTLPGVEISGSHVIVEKITVQDAKADGVLVKAADGALSGCLVRGCKGAAVRGQGAARLAIRHCTLAD